MTDKQNIHDNVRQHYGAIARAAATENPVSCCGGTDTITLDSIGTKTQTACCDNTDHALNLYGAESLGDLPVDVTGLSLGCGDPVTIAGLKPGETVLDLGSGGGIDCFLAARQVGESGYVIGVDMTPDMLAKANANKLKLGAENVEFRRGQIEDLPVQDNTIDVMMSNCVINLSPDKAAVFREAFRVLKPGGRVSVSDIVTEGAFTDEMRADAEKWSECVTGAVDITDYIGLMREAGFVDIEVRDKVEADVSEIDPAQRIGIPRIFSARITARKPV
jgi:arsenite methyltransferase